MEPSGSSSARRPSARVRSRRSKGVGARTIIELIDLTTLEGADTPGKVRSLVVKATSPDPGDPECPSVAAVCVYGDMVPYAVAALGRSSRGRRGDTGCAIAAVATAFPSGAQHRCA